MLADTQTKRKNGRAVRKPHAAKKSPEGHALPGVPEVENAGTRLVRRAVSLTFLVLAVGLIGALIVASVVRIDVSVEASGILRPTELWPVRSLESSTIVEVPVSSGDTVRQGQALIRLDSLQLKSDLAQLQSQYDALDMDLRKARSSRVLQEREQEQARERAEAELIGARADLRRELVVFGYEPEVDIDSFLVNYTPGSKTRIDRAVAQVRSAKAGLRSVGIERDRVRLGALDLQRQQTESRRVEAQVRSIRERLDRLTVISPAAGVILTDRLKQMTGRFVQRGELLLEIAELNQWQADLFVGERSVDELDVGDPAKIEIQAFRSEGRNLIRGRVVAIASEPIEAGNEARGGSASGRYRVTVRLNEGAIRKVNRDRLRQGYSVRGEVITRSGRIITLLWNYLKEQTA